MNQARRGFTLIELLMASALLSVVVLAIALVLVQQQRLFKDNEQIRISDENSRIAFNQLWRSIREAGFGMDPELAVDFENYTCDLYSGGGLALTGSGCTAGTRQKTSASDELVLYHRYANYQIPETPGAPPLGQAWLTAAGTSTSQLVLTPAATTAGLRKGQILLISCGTGTIYTYVTLGANSDGSGTITLDSTKTDAFHQQSAFTSFSCLKTSAYVFRIERERYFVAQGPAVNGIGHPYLMLDKGIDVNGNGSIDDADLIPVASDVVDMQVAYEYAQDPGEQGRATVGLVDASSASPDSVLYDDSGDAAIAEPTALVQPGGCPDMEVPYYGTRCYFARRSLDPLRFNSDPANIVGIRVALVVRSASPDEGMREAKKNPQIPAVLDRAAAAASSNLNGSCPAANATCDGFRYSVIDLAEVTPNLASRAQFLW